MIKEFYFFGRTYYSEMWIFRITALLLLAFALYVAFVAGADKYYSTTCKDADLCQNFFYNNTNYCGKDIGWNNSLCIVQFIPKGVTIGAEPPFWLKNGWIIPVGIVLIAFIINHLLYNTGFKSKNDQVGGFV